MKITVYAICKNEMKNIDGWYDSMQEADEIVVLDTGSTDESYEYLKTKPKVKVIQKILRPFRFDNARNESLKLVSKDTDICICTDLDERFSKNWRHELEKYWRPNTTRARYTYNWNFDEYGNPTTTFLLDKIHTRNNYTWTNAVHEILTTDITENIINIPSIILNHFPDQEKSRSSYLHLLELSVKENPENDRNVHYLGREYTYYKRWDDAINTLHNHLKLKSATWKDERCASMRYIAYSYYQKGYLEETIYWYKSAINEAPNLREPLYDLALIYFKEHNYLKSIYYLEKALKIKEKIATYIIEEKAWNENIYELLSLSYFYTNNFKKSYKNISKAYKLNPLNKEIAYNYDFIKRVYNLSQNKEDIYSK